MLPGKQPGDSLATHCVGQKAACRLGAIGRLIQTERHYEDPWVLRETDKPVLPCESGVPSELSQGPWRAVALPQSGLSSHPLPDAEAGEKAGLGREEGSSLLPSPQPAPGPSCLMRVLGSQTPDMHLLPGLIPLLQQDRFFQALECSASKAPPALAANGADTHVQGRPSWLLQCLLV